MPMINREGVHPPGGFPFQDRRTGKRFDGMSADFRGQVANIINHRRANPTLYPPTEPKFLSTESVGEELDKYQCDRLGNDPRFCNSGSAVAPRYKAELTADKACSKCGSTDLEPRYCAVCSGKKLVGYTCKGCKSAFDL